MFVLTTLSALGGSISWKGTALAQTDPGFLSYFDFLTQKTMFYWEKLTVENDFKYILLGIHDFEFFLPTAIMEIFAFKVGVGPNGPQQYLIGLKSTSCLPFKIVTSFINPYNLTNAANAVGSLKIIEVHFTKSRA